MPEPGFYRAGGANSPEGGGRQHKILPTFLKKLHEIERIWTPGASLAPLLDPLLICIIHGKC